LKIKNENLLNFGNKGLYCSICDTWIDPIRPVKRAIITHAHFDHVSIGCNEYISSYETSILLRERLGNKINIKAYDYGEIFKINGVSISLHPSGHILGASQIRFEAGGIVWLVTGDFKKQFDSTCSSFDVINTDYLICESTFSLPIFKWENSELIANDISNWVEKYSDKTSLLFCYSLGKAQRLLNEIKDKKIKKIFTHNSITKINKCYKKLGIDLIDTINFDKNNIPKDTKGTLLLLPPSLNNKNFLKAFDNPQTAFASGWMLIRALKKRSGYDKGFVISDHADWSGLIKAIRESKAKKVYLTHGDGDHLAKYLKNKDNLDISSETKI
tara:strand:- start:108 stop:1094 length:987 start_codon:yes stop_codon:yes gene_type:complete